jgi:hypothetical protein
LLIYIYRLAKTNIERRLKMIGKKFIALFVIGGLTASIGISAGAYTKNVSSNAKINYKQSQGQNKLEDIQYNIKTKLDALVKKGAIAQPLEDKVLTYISKKEADSKTEMAKIKAMTPADRKTYMESKIKTAGTNIFTDMVSSGAFTQAEADSLKALLPNGPANNPMGFIGRGRGRGLGKGIGLGYGNPSNNIKAKLDAAVKAGTLSQAVEDKVVAYENTQQATRKAEMDKLKAMTPADRKTYMESKIKAVKTDMFASMVTSGTLTQAEADSLEVIFAQNKPEFDKTKSADMQGNMKAKLDTLVKAGTITQAIEDSVIAYYKQEQAAQKAEMDKVKAMTAADRKAYMDSKAKVKRTAPLSDLVTKGILTQAQADAINKLQPGHPGGFGGPGGLRGFRGRH